jgi:anti-sigma factor RsiW
MTLLQELRDRRECRKVQPLLQQFLDGTLPAHLAAQVVAHVEACRRCGLEADTYQRLKSALGDLRSEPDPAAVGRLAVFVDGLAASGGGSAPP